MADCPFCKISSGEIPAKKVFENDIAIAFLDINPRNPGHTLVIPKKHYETLFDMPSEEAGEFFESVSRIATAVKNGVNADGLSLSQNNYRAAGQVVPHLHFHLIPRFNTEGPLGLEGVLPVKKMDDKSLDKVVSAISDNIESEPERRPAPKKEAKEAEKEESDEDEEFAEFDF
ncbi:MAG: HIT family protein [Thermoplasmatales archaeon]|nr:MAG: HIT family protein [Thermoplasmatales archaeon]